MATQYARVRKEKDGRLAISLWYADGRSDRTTVWIDRKQQWFDVPYAIWAQHIGRTIDLSTWAGSGEGMIGGPTRTQIADFLYCGVLERGFPPYDPTKLRREIASFEEWLDDERYELAPDVRDRVESYVAKGRRWLEQVRQTSSGDQSGPPDSPLQG